MHRAKNNIAIGAVDSETNNILDVGCGTGTNAKEIKSRFSSINICGVSNDSKELETAQKHLDQSYLLDLNVFKCNDINQKFDLIICSHVLEHLINPKLVVAELSKLLKKDSRLLIILPNFAIWSSRLRLLRGTFEYQDDGLYDRTHLRFFTYYNYESELTSNNLVVEKKYASGHLPLPLLRRFLPIKVQRKIDNTIVKHFPNLFGNELILSLKLK